MHDRRFSEAEVTEIFERATHAEETAPRTLARADGMTLAELQAVGEEAGIAPAAIAAAAHSLTRSVPTETRRLFGISIGVGRTVELDRRLSDDEWERVVVLLRETFDARGTLRAHGSLREWSNGNLQALLEPTERGHRLRLRTRHSGSQALLLAGATLLGLSAAVTVATAATVGLGDAAAVENISTLGVIGAGTFLAGFFRRRGWVIERQRQFEEIAAKLAP